MVLRIHLEKALKEAKTNASIDVKISNMDALVNKLAASNFKPQMSNREALRLVGETVRTTVTDALYEHGNMATLTLRWDGKKLVADQNSVPAVARKSSPATCRQLFK